MHVIRSPSRNGVEAGQWHRGGPGVVVPPVRRGGLAEELIKVSSDRTIERIWTPRCEAIARPA